MKRPWVLLAACFVLVPAAVFAAAMPPPPSHTYSDPAMSYTAPADYIPIPVPSQAPTGFTQPTVMALYVRHPRRADQSVITITMESNTGDLQSYEQSVESDVRNQGGQDSPIFIQKTLTALPNGMPAYFLRETIGEDIGEQRRFEYVWVDGVRGVRLAVMAGFGVIGDDTAKEILSNVHAVAFPQNRYY